MTAPKTADQMAAWSARKLANWKERSSVASWAAMMERMRAYSMALLMAELMARI
jgi:hypothetical protein